MTGAEKLIDAVGYLDDDLIEEAEQVRFSQKPHKTYSKPMRFAALAACCAMLVFGAFLFPKFFINLGNKSAKDAAAPAAAQQEAATATDEAAAGGAITEEALEEAKAEAGAKSEEKNEVTITTTQEEPTEEAVADDETAMGPNEYGETSQAEDSTAASDSATYGETAGILLWPDSAATVSINGVLFQAASVQDLVGGIRETAAITPSQFDLTKPAGTISEASDQIFLGTSYYEATIDNVHYLLVEQPEGLYLFQEKKE